MRDGFPDVPSEALEQGGPFTFEQALSAGWSSWEVEAALKGDHLTKVTRGVYVLTASLTSCPPKERHVVLLRGRLLGLGAGWCAARRTGAWLLDLPLIGRPPEVPQLLRDLDGSRSKGRNRHERVAALPSDQRCELDGIAICSVARIVVDIARQEVFRNGVVVADAALRAGVTLSDLEAVAKLQRRWPGIVNARAVIAFADGRAESAGESVTRVAVHREGLPIPEPQVEVWRHGKLIARLDFLYREQLLALESNGAIKFTTAGVLPALLARNEDIRDCGIDVIQTNWDETFKSSAALGRRIRERLDVPRQLAPGVQLVSTTVPELAAA
jgi:hypothetical protein